MMKNGFIRVEILWDYRADDCDDEDLFHRVRLIAASCGGVASMEYAVIVIYRQDHDEAIRIARKIFELMKRVEEIVSIEILYADEKTLDVYEAEGE